MNVNMHFKSATLGMVLNDYISNSQKVKHLQHFQFEYILK